MKEWKEFYVPSTVYPNPITEGTGTLTISGDTLNGSFTLTIYAGNGKIEETLEFTGNTVQLPELKIGIYYYRIVGTDYKLVSRGRIQIE